MSYRDKLLAMADNADLALLEKLDQHISSAKLKDAGLKTKLISYIRELQSEIVMAGLKNGN